jgi:hypothetical protein
MTECSTTGQRQLLPFHLSREFGEEPVDLVVGGAPQWFPLPPPQALDAVASDRQQCEQAMASELQKENCELRKLAQRLQEQLAAAEQRELGYQRSAEELLARKVGVACDSDLQRCEEAEQLSPQQALELEALHELADGAMMEEIGGDTEVSCRMSSLSTKVQELTVKMQAYQQQVSAELERGGVHCKSVGPSDLHEEQHSSHRRGLASDECRFHPSEGIETDDIQWAMPPRKIWD